MENTSSTQAATFYQLDKVRDMLFASDQGLRSLAIQILKGQDFFVELEDDLLIASKTLPDSAQRAELRKMLSSKGNPTLKELYKNSRSFDSLAQFGTEKMFREKLIGMSKEVDWPQMRHFCLLLHRTYGRGLSFLLTLPLHNEYRQEVLQLMTQDGLFDYHALLGYRKRRKDSIEDQYVSSYTANSKIKFPIDHPSPHLVKKLNLHNCKLKTLPPQIKVFEVVEEIDFSSNCLKTLPLTFTKLRNLKRLDLSFNHLESFPPVLMRMQNLEYLNLQNNAAKGYSPYNQTISFDLEAFRKNNPNCEIIL